MTLQAITANRLGDGLSVFLAEDGSWSTDFAQSRVVEDGEAASLEDAGEAAVAANHIVGPYLIDVEAVEGGYRATKYRERIRIDGPSRETRPGDHKHGDHKPGANRAA